MEYVCWAESDSWFCCSLSIKNKISLHLDKKDYSSLVSKTFFDPRFFLCAFEYYDNAENNELVVFKDRKRIMSVKYDIQFFNN